jgi:hypothetical protein
MSDNKVIYAIDVVKNEPVYNKQIYSYLGTAVCPPGEPDDYIEVHYYSCPICNTLLISRSIVGQSFYCMTCNRGDIELPKGSK